ncbi:hypothetical protein CFC21_081323, partial [Triticum aestivum]
LLAPPPPPPSHATSGPRGRRSRGRVPFAPAGLTLRAGEQVEAAPPRGRAAEGGRLPPRRSTRRGGSSSSRRSTTSASPSGS